MKTVIFARNFGMSVQIHYSCIWRFIDELYGKCVLLLTDRINLITHLIFNDTSIRQRSNKVTLWHASKFMCHQFKGQCFVQFMHVPEKRATRIGICTILNIFYIFQKMRKYESLQKGCHRLVLARLKVYQINLSRKLEIWEKTETMQSKESFEFVKVLFTENVCILNPSGNQAVFIDMKTHFLRHVSSGARQSFLSIDYVSLSSSIFHEVFFFFWEKTHIAFFWQFQV